MKAFNSLMVSVHNALRRLARRSQVMTREEIEIAMMKRFEKPSVMAIIYLLDRNGICAGVVEMYSTAAARRDIVFRENVVELVRQYRAYGVYVGIPRFEGRPSIPKTVDCLCYEGLQMMLAKENACLMDVVIINNGLIQSVAAWWKYLHNSKGVCAFSFQSERVTEVYQCFTCGVYTIHKPDDGMCITCESYATEESRSVECSVSSTSAFNWIFVISLGVFCFL